MLFVCFVVAVVVFCFALLLLPLLRKESRHRFLLFKTL